MSFQVAGPSVMPNQLNYNNGEISHGIEKFVGDIVMSNKKRKRGAADMNGETSGAKRNSIPNMNGNGEHANGSSGESFSDNSNDFSNLGQQLSNAVHSSNDPGSSAAAALASQLGMGENSNVSFVSTGSGTDGDRHLDTSFDLSGGDNSQHHHQPYNLAPYASVGGTAAQVQAAREASNGGAIKPTVGSDEWHKVRRDNHKEVERRRRETINEGINELAKIVPGCEKNKGSILQRAVQYIQDLKRAESESKHGAVLEKNILEQALAEVNASNEHLKGELNRAWKENKALQQRLRDLGHGAELDAGGSVEGDSE